DAPVVTAGAVTGYTENGVAVAIDNTIAVSDVDDTQIAGATVTISAGLTAGDALGFTNTASITGVYNAGTGVLTLTGTDTLAADQAALRSVTYSSTSDDPSALSASRTISWQVTDANSDGTGAQTSAVVASTVNLTALADAPVATAGAVTGYTENAAAVVIDNTITVSDVDDTQIAGATVTISAGLTAGDVLGFTNTASISGVYNAGTGVLTLSGTDTLAAYQAALRSVTYSSTSEDPTATSASRTIAWQVTDADSDAAGAATSVAVADTMNVTAVNDAPVLGANALTIDQGGSALLNPSILSATDVDNPAATLSFLVGNVANGRFELISAPGVAVTSFTQAEVLAGQVRFVHDGNPAVPGYDVRVSDGGLTIGPFAASVTFNPTALTVSTPPSAPPPPPPSLAIEPPAPAPEPVAEAAPATGEPGAALIDAGFSPGRVLANFNDLTEISVRLAAAEARVPLKVAPPPESNPNRYEARPSVEPQVELLNMLPAELSFTPSMPGDWVVTSAFKEGADEQIRNELEVLLDSVKFGGMALSVGVVWWASRISGLLGTLIASTPAWRHIDPLPVLGRDDKDEDKWYEPDDSEADANELAVSLVLDGGRRAAGERDE
ncbi:MAG TPA: cadherin-like domain-containing protein, partial [Burkholderiales bacterium]